MELHLRLGTQRLLELQVEDKRRKSRNKGDAYPVSRMTLKD